MDLARQRLEKFLSSPRLEVGDIAPCLTSCIAVAVYWALAIWRLHLWARPGNETLHGILFSTTFAFVLILRIMFVTQAIYIWITENPPKLLPRTFAEWRLRWPLYACYSFAFCAALVMYTPLKETILITAPNEFDIAFAQLSRLMGFGRQPWEWLQPVFGPPWVTVVLDWNYVKGWSLVMFSASGLVLVQRKDRDLAAHYDRAKFLVHVVAEIAWHQCQKSCSVTDK
jgi:hypothetical protein